jgi:hypothetical protein
MNNLPRALLAIHNPRWEIVSKRMLTKYEISTAQNIGEMKKIMNISPEGFPNNFFSLYMMDANFGFPGKDTCAPAEEIFKLIKKDYENGKVKFLTITGNPDLVENTNNKGILCFNKSDLEKMFKYINS